MYYRVDDDAWEKVVRWQVDSLRALGQIVQAGVDLVGASPKRAARVRTAYEVFRWIERAFADTPPPSAARARKR